MPLLVDGIGMGGEWGLGASLAMEKIPAEKRGFWSGVLQQGYPVGYMFAALAFFIITPWAGWRGAVLLRRDPRAAGGLHPHARRRVRGMAGDETARA